MRGLSSTRWMAKQSSFFWFSGVLSRFPYKNCDPDQAVNDGGRHDQQALLFERSLWPLGCLFVGRRFASA